MKKPVSRREFNFLLAGFLVGAGKLIWDGISNLSLENRIYTNEEDIRKNTKRANEIVAKTRGEFYRVDDVMSKTSTQVNRISEDLLQKDQEQATRAFNIWKIYNQLVNHVYPFVVSSEGTDKMRTSLGIVLNGKFLTMGHSVVKDDKMKNPVLILGDKKLEKIVSKYDPKQLLIGEDIAIYNLPKSLSLPDFPCKPSIETHLGEEIYLVGNPEFTGKTIRPGTITDLDSLTIYGGEANNRYFGIDIPVIPGDSGGPVVNSNFELLGLSSGCAFDSFAYIVRVGEFMKYL